jgi:oligoribonuclease NrnB/cAMP/cGMP phosphodiesterase (DHH superfamily)
MEVILYHGGDCRDGFCSAWIAHIKHPEAKFIPINYGQPLPYEELRGKEVLFADFCPAEHLNWLTEKCWHLTILDHHKTSLAKLCKFLKIQEEDKLEYNAPNLHVVFDMNKSGAMLTWEYFFSELPAPPIVNLVQDRDLWNWELGNSREFNAVIESHDMSFPTWSILSTKLENAVKRNQLIAEGAAILRYKKSLIDAQCKHADTTDCLGHTVPFMNATMLISEIGEQLAKDHPYSLTWFRRKDGLYIYSLRSSEEGMDVSEIAKKMGGGGHKHAAGFQSVKPL